MPYVITLSRDLSVSETPGSKTGFIGVAAIRPSTKYPQHPFFQMGRFQNPPIDSSTDLRVAVRIMLDFIFPLSNAIVPDPGLSIEIDWPKARERANEALRSVDELAGYISREDERNLYKQALEIVQETIEFVLEQTSTGENYSLLWQGFD